MPGPDVPEEIRALVDDRDDARAAKDYARADELRARIEAAGFTVRDTPAGGIVEPRPAFEVIDPRAVVDTLADPPDLGATFVVGYEGFSEDLDRFLSGLFAHSDPAEVEVIVVVGDRRHDAAVEDLIAPFASARALHLEPDLGWAVARNAGLKQARGAICVLADLSIEPLGDLAAPLAAALADPAVAVVGPYGLVSEDMRSWRPSDGPQAHAIEGYLLAARRSGFAGGLINDRFRWYRNADIDVSFQLRADGGDARVVPVPVAKHAHRGWEALNETERDKRSRHNHYIFFDRWKGRTDLLAP